MTLSKSEQETAEIAGNLAKSLAKGDVLCLYGDLGAGKTVFSRALIRALCDNPNIEVPSPTFTLLQTYQRDTDSDHHQCDISHYDLYRLEDPQEIEELGWQDSLYEGITIVEWPVRLGTFLPAKRIDITIETQDNNRIINIERITP